MQITSMQRKWREDFPGTTLDPARWQTIQQGAGHALGVSGSNLTIATGTTPNSETILRSVLGFTIPFRVMFIFMLSQRIANQEFVLEVINAAGSMLARWRLDGTGATTGHHQVANGGVLSAAFPTTIPTTSGFGTLEIELFADEVYFHGRIADSVTQRTTTVVRTRLIPDPNEVYFVQIRAANLASAPASSTTLTVDAITVQDIAELSAEITAGRGQTAASQALAAWIAGGTLTVLSTGHVQSINVAFADTSAALGANAVFNGTSRDFGATQRVNRFLAAATADREGTLFIEQSNDGTNWVMTHRLFTANVPDAGGITRHVAFADAEVCNRFARVRYLNGALAQGVFRLISMQRGI